MACNTGRITISKEWKLDMKAFVNGKHDRRKRPLYSLMEISAASGLPVYQGGDADVVFNWGGSFLFRPRAKIILNENPMFGKCAQALAIKRAGVTTPQPYRNIREVTKFPVLEKPNESYGGKGIKLLRTKPVRYVQRGNVWYQQFITKAKEYRVYFFNDKIAMVSEKLVKDTKKVVWNIANCIGWERHRRLEKNEKLTNLVTKSAEAVRLDWGAADVLEDRNGKFWMCEINSRPSCWNRERPKLPMTLNENGVWTLTKHQREELSLSARMWGNRMHRFLREVERGDYKQTKPKQEIEKRKHWPET
jgi:hypothetical protein